MAPLDGYIDDHFFTHITISWELILVFQKAFKSCLEVNFPKITQSQDKIGICV